MNRRPAPDRARRFPVGQHARVGDHGHLEELVGGLEGLDRRDDRGGLGTIALEGFDHQREPARIGQQADRDLWLQATFLGVSGLPETVTGIGLEGGVRWFV